MKQALIVIDVQNDFCPGGALAVPGGDEVVGVCNGLIHAFERRSEPVVLTRDWHPASHCSFTKRGGPWPPHCVAGTAGAGFHPGLTQSPAAHIVSKALEPDKEAYSGFDDANLAPWLRANGVVCLTIAGLATDYCVKATVLDALREGFEVEVVREGIRAVNVQPGDGARAIEAMQRAGARIVKVEDIILKE